MGCNCKKTTTNSGIEVEESSIIIKILKGVLFTIGLTIISPLILLFIWVYGMNSAFNGDIDMIGYIIKKYKEKSNNEIEEDDEINLDEYELVDVEEIKQ